MTPAAAREELFRRALVADRLRVWLASAAYTALAWERGTDGGMVARGPTPAEVDALERHAADLPRPEVESALALLRDVSG